MTSEKIFEVMKKNTIGDGEDIIINQEKSQGSWIIDQITGKSLLDLSSQFASQALGWNHPRLIENELILGKSAKHKLANSDFYSKEMSEFVDIFSSDAKDFSYFFFIDGGSAGVENSIKCSFDYKAKKLGLKDDQVNGLDVIHLKQAFHGRGGITMSLTNTSPEKTDLFPKFKWTRVINPKITSIEKDTINLEEKSINEIKIALAKGNVAAIILEPVQSEGGDVHFRKEYFIKLRELTNQFDAMLIFDEVQTGVGITGKFWCYEHFGVTPDLMCFGKKTQVCGFCSTKKVDEVQNNVFKVSSRINSTFGGSLVDFVRYSIISKTIKEENLVENSRLVGEYFLEQLNKVNKIENIRGRGLMLAFDLPNKELRDKTINEIKNYASILSCGEKSIRLRPHLTFKKEEVDIALNIISDCVNKIL